jgi:hypothetical protein
LAELPPDDVLILEKLFTSKELKAVVSLVPQDVQVGVTGWVSPEL